jgi:hypothetical protein
MNIATIRLKILSNIIREELDDVDQTIDRSDTLCGCRALDRDCGKKMNGCVFGFPTCNWILSVSLMELKMRQPGGNSVMKGLLDTLEDPLRYIPALIV